MDENEIYSLPSEINEEIRLISFITVNTVLIFAIFLYFGFSLRNMVYPPLQIPFLIYNSFIGFLVTVKSRTNPQKRLYQSVLLYLFRNNHEYEPIESTKELPDTVIKFKKEKGAVKYVSPEEYF